MSPSDTPLLGGEPELHIADLAMDPRLAGELPGFGALSPSTDIAACVANPLRRPPMSSPVFVIAEAGVNHNGSLDCARKLIDVAADAGADAVKFQTFRSELVISRGARKAQYQVTNTGDDESQLEMVKRLE